MTYTIEEYILDKTSLRRGDFHFDENLLLIGNTSGLVFDAKTNLPYDEEMERLRGSYYCGLIERVQTPEGRKTVIVGDKDTINTYKNFFSNVFGNPNYISNHYDYPVCPNNSPLMFITIEDKISQIPNTLKNIKFDHIVSNLFSKDEVTEIKENLNYDNFVDIVSSIEDKYNLFYLNIGNCKAMARRVENGLIVLKGSIIRVRSTKDVSNKTAKRREDAIKTKAESTNNPDYVKIIEDVFCETPSAAASFVTGTSANGRDDWKNEQGQSYGHIYDSIEGISISA